MKCFDGSFSIAAVLLALASHSACAIVMRDDRDEERYLELASRFPATTTLWQNDTEDSFCGEGTLIDPSWVLTAGHIASDLKPGGIAKVAGQELRIERALLHPKGTA